MSENDNHHAEDTEAPATCSCCGGDLFEEKPPLWKQKPIAIIIISATIFVIAIYLEKFLNQGLLAEIAF
ncbi:MAG: cation-transporting P-type ATPase, partial [Methanobacteriaceae archaeon]|nr:cation-transporting P-type ATPase [Methanobacteriaceae archaeon]